MSAPHTTTDHPQHSSAAHPGRWACVILLGVIVLQFIRNSPDLGPAQPPGPERGDIVLNAGALPTDIEGWTQIEFTPPKVSFDRQSFWTHAWQYQQPSATATVTFDQANWTGWHELSECYFGQGWELVDRDVIDEPDTTYGRWGYVIARLRRSPTEYCVVIFSMFFEDTTPVQPRGHAISSEENPGINARITRRLAFDVADKELRGLRALQCQVIVPYDGELREDIIRNAVQLHLETRRQFCRLWHTAD